MMNTTRFGAVETTTRPEAMSPAASQGGAVPQLGCGRPHAFDGVFTEEVLSAVEYLTYGRARQAGVAGDVSTGSHALPF